MISEPIGQGRRFAIGQQIAYPALLLIGQNRPI
jgi:hypothetical protein